MDLNTKNLIFLDFETDSKGEFFIAGIKQNGNFEQIVLHSGLMGLADEHGLKKTTPKEFVSTLLFSSPADSIIIGYSILEKDLIRDLIGSTGIERFPNTKYVNLLRVAKRWIGKYKKEKFDALPPFRKDPKRWGAKRLPNSLASVMRLTNFPPPFDYAPGHTSTKFKTVLASLVKKDHNYTLLTSKQKKKATECLKHNKFDVEALEVLTGEISVTDTSLFKPHVKPLFESD